MRPQLPDRTPDAAVRARDDEDAAVVIAALAMTVAAATPASPESARTLWGSPEHRLGATPVGPHGWWASAMPR